MNVMSYNADQILTTAIEIEHNASAYYRDASRVVRDVALSGTLHELSGMEQRHAETFTAMRSELSDEERSVQPFDPGDEMNFYLEGMKGLHGWEGKAGPNARLSGNETVGELLEIALRAEQDTVFFYTFVKEFVPVSRGRAAVEEIITEEMRHIATIKRYLHEHAG
jgi:rubrerythrin